MPAIQSAPRVRITDATGIPPASLAGLPNPKSAHTVSADASEPAAVCIAATNREFCSIGGPGARPLHSAHELGISAEGILTESHAWTTCEEATRIGTLLQPRHMRRILLVTNPQHMLQARAVFEHAGFEVFPAPADDGSGAARSPEERLWLTREVLQEWVARMYYRAAGYL